MQQVFIDYPVSCGQVISFDEKVTHHLQHVLRMKENEIIRVVNGEAFLASIVYDNGVLKAVIKEKHDHDSEIPCEVILAISLIKKDKWELLLQKCTELGVSRIIPFKSSRTIIDDAKFNDKKSRYEKILSEASQQCKRNVVPVLEDVVSLKQLNGLADINCVAYESMTYPSSSLKDIIKPCSSILIVIGPEGGFSESEIDLLVNKGFQCVTLGKRILRAETACMYAISVIGALLE